ncbi:MAG: porin family protein [Flavobacteriaceae bacterium]|nr:porin family protein [Flavobacteriaceae bacterium]
MNFFLNQIMATLIISLIFCSSAMANDVGYFGAGVARVDVSNTADGSDAGDANGLILYAGKRLGHIGFELNYFDVGDIDVPNSSVVISGRMTRILASLSTDPSKELVLFLNFGVAISDLKDSLGTTHTDTETTIMPGINYSISSNYSVRADYTQYEDLTGVDFDIISFSVNRSF